MSLAFEGKRAKIITAARVSTPQSAAALQICLQIAYIFVPVASAITALTEALLAYLATAGVASAATHGGAVPPPQPGAAVLAPEHLASAWDVASRPQGGAAFDGEPFEYLSPWLPQAMFEHIAALVTVGVRMDAVAASHGIAELRALDVIKQQVSLRQFRPIATVRLGANAGRAHDN